MVIKLFYLKSCCSQFVVLIMAFFSLSFIDFKISILFYLSVSNYFSLNLIDRFISLPCVLLCYSVCLSSLFSLPLLLQLYRPLTLHLHLFLFSLSLTFFLNLSPSITLPLPPSLHFDTIIKQSTTDLILIPNPVGGGYRCR